ncbi:carboxylesterase family protein [Halopseudomonas aestusnigri]|uniref:carboxylesterase/lipase family protein n=1 Tax=Halopseudomonas aestusnigri TaxID=857252 RepID=UPI001E476813|nr:carboxylesterase family protein [Halopseudomonas aestusnigri]UGV31247.1 carboxylesterase family protein [Halopseudomonas aestusnigri]
MQTLLANFPAVRLALAAVVTTSLSLTGCLSGGGGSSSDGAATVEEPTDLRTTLSGDVRGVEQEGYFEFLGIPYAAAPVGDLRFAAPQAAAGWDEERAADAYGSACPQAGLTFDEAEDCLYLNVFTPKTRGPHPVMVWFHGGAFVFGSGGGTYVPPRLVAEDIVVVTVNYRLGKLGFTAHPGLTEEQGASGSYGILDQQMALQWVQDNIEAFAGDPANVTIFGESAGGLSVLSHLVSPASSGLFAKAIVQSGSYSRVQASMAVAESAGEGFATLLGCDAATAAQEVECMRSKSVAHIMAIAPGTVTPTLRPDVLPASVNQGLAAGEFNDVPLLMGTNSDEWSYFLASRGELNPITQANYQFLLNNSVGPVETPNVVSLYPASDFSDDYAALMTAVGTDGNFACNASVQAASVAENGSQPLFVYEFADRDAPSPGIVAPSWLTLGATHASELAYLFGTDDSFRLRGATDDQVALADIMSRAWTTFARSGSPGHEDLNWVDYGDSAGGMVSFETPEVQPLSRSVFRSVHRCDYWTPEV